MGAAQSADPQTAGYGAPGGYGNLAVDDNDDIHAAIRSGDLGKIKELATLQGIDLNMTGENGDSPLHIAVRCNQPDLVSELVEGGASLEAVDSNGDNALHFAVKAGRPRMVKALCDCGAPMDLPNKDHLSPLHLACVKGPTMSVDTRVSILDILCKAGAFTEVVDKQGRAPIHYAALFNSTSLVAVLIRNDARRGFQDHDNQRAMDLAEKEGYRGVVRYLNSVDAQASQGKLSKYDKYLG